MDLFINFPDFSQLENHFTDFHDRDNSENKEQLN